MAPAAEDLRLFHIVSEEDWQQCCQQDSYAPDSLDKEGFIHLSLSSQVAATYRRFYAGRSSLLLVEIRAERLEVELRYEEADYQMFPHLYGPLNLSALEAVHPLIVDALGNVRLPTQ